MPDTLPAWPRVLSQDLAAAYLSISTATFARLVADGKAPAAIRLSPGRVGWDRRALDRWVDEQTAGTAACAPGANPWDSIFSGNGPA